MWYYNPSFLRPVCSVSLSASALPGCWRAPATPSMHGGPHGSPSLSSCPSVGAAPQDPSHPTNESPLLLCLRNSELQPPQVWLLKVLLGSFLKSVSVLHVKCLKAPRFLVLFHRRCRLFGLWVHPGTCLLGLVSWSSGCFSMRKPQAREAP